MFDLMTHRLSEIEHKTIEKFQASAHKLSPKIWQRNFPYFVTIITLAFPLIIAYLADVAIIPSVSAVIGRLGVTALAAIVSFEIMAKLLSEKAARTLSPVVTRIASAQSKGNEARVRLEAGSAVALAVILGLLVSVLSLFIPEILALSSQNEEMIRLTQDYASIAAWRLLVATLLAALRAISLGLEDTIISSVVPVPGLLVAVGLTAIMVSSKSTDGGATYFYAMGIKGAAWGLLLAYIYMLVSLLWSILEHQAIWYYRNWRASLRCMWEIFREGMSIPMRFNVVTGSIAGFGLVVGTIGGVELAAHQLAISLYFTLSIIGLAVGEAVMVLLAASLAREAYALARKFALAGLVLSLGLMSLIALIVLFNPTLVAQIFVGRHPQDSLTLDVMGKILQFSVLALIGGGVYETLAMYMRPLGGTRYLLKVAIFAIACFGIGGAVILRVVFDQSLMVMWIMFDLGLFLATFLLWRDVWRRINAPLKKKNNKL
ncbi:MAG: MATE family efflux transporter [Candidatus Symbiobacter sp.]|nr:MATE family efflux transporter [Candidatus Symbiobacter sp.]